MAGRGSATSICSESRGVETLKPSSATINRVYMPVNDRCRLSPHRVSNSNVDSSEEACVSRLSRRWDTLRVEVEAK
jgi:hypothetical protein